jgi:DNA-binding IclR family transcriptional regulator
MQMAHEGKGSTVTYKVPALDKGLDILECLSDSRVPLTQAQIARKLGRGSSEIFRMLTTLERRQYIARDPISGAFSLTLKLFELGQVHSPYEIVVRAARGAMQDLAAEIQQSCHLSVIWRGDVVVLHQEEAPTRVRLSVEIGSTIPVLESVSGRLLVAQLSDADRERLLNRQTAFPTLAYLDQLALLHRLTEIRNRGYDSARSEHIAGVSDIAVLVGTETTSTQAALAVAALCGEHDVFIDEHIDAMRRHAVRISRSIGLVPSTQESE